MTARTAADLSAPWGTKKPRPSQQLHLRWAQPRLPGADGLRADPAHLPGFTEALGLAETDAALEPYSLQWFLAVEGHRYGRRGRWLAELLEFHKHEGETVLGLGEGMGFDWLQFAKEGASVICCQQKAADLALTRKNFQLRGMSGQFLQAAPTHLPLPSQSVDVVCVNGLLHRHADPAAVAAEISRVLKLGGKALVLAPARSYPWLSWLRTTPPAPRAESFSRRQLRQLFPQFQDHMVHKRHLRRRDYRWACRWLPRPLLERLIGECFILRCFKPVKVEAMEQRPPLRLAA